MATQASRTFDDYVDLNTGTVDRDIFSDEDIYKLEMERIFGRTWNFMCHESQIPKPGDFFLNYIGEESVIATRDRTGKLQVFLNSCRHRGNTVCRSESGNARAFLCTYHGWTFGLDGKLMGVPGYRDLYHEDLDREKWGLISAGKVQSYKGFVFANMDPDAPDLEEFLGDVGRIGLDMIAARGDVAVVDGIQKNVLDCNWKIAVDNIFDWYHVDISHASATMSGFIVRPQGDLPEDDVRNIMGSRRHRVVLGDYGHAISGPRVGQPIWNVAEGLAKQDINALPVQMRDLAWRSLPETKAELGPVGADSIGHPNIFPNVWVASIGNQICLRLPKGPGKTELWWFTFINRDTPPEYQAAVISRASKGFGPAGMLEQDDGENWEQSTAATRGPIARKYPLNYQMNFGRGEVEKPANGPAHIDTHVSEHAQLWTYRAWADWMNADSWAALRDNRASVPDRM